MRLLLESTFALDGQFGSLRKQVSHGPRGCGCRVKCCSSSRVDGVELCAFGEKVCMLERI